MILKHWISAGSGGPVSRSMTTFWSGGFDFENNLWIDTSGNGNHLSLVNASARTGNGLDLDYLITGLLTSDTVEAVDGSDVPTIANNGVLRIGAAQVVYGVTIKRSGVIWAVIPFCEPVVSGNLPTRSFDVSGNGHHASCATIAAGNIAMQSNYFYLQRYGYSLGSENILNWNMASWSGDPLLYTAIFAGVTLGDAQSANAYLQPTPDGLGCRYTRNATFNLRMRRFSAMVSGRSYRATLRIANFTSTGASGGLQVGNLGITTANKNWIIADGVFDYRRAAVNTTFEMGASSTSVGTVIDIYDPELRVLEVVPGLLSGASDAVGRSIEFVADGKTLLKYGGSIQAPSSLITADQKGCWSDYINQGYLVAGRTYLIEKTELNHFGSGLEIYDEFIAAGTEYCDQNNVVRELILNSTERGFFFDDDTTPHPRSYSDFTSIRSHFIYCRRPKTLESHTYYYVNPNIYPPYLNLGTGFGWKGYIEDDVISEMIIIKPTAYLSDASKLKINQYLAAPESLDFALFSIIFDSIEADELDAIVAAIESRKNRLVRALYVSDIITKGDNDAVLLAAGHEIISHTPAFQVNLPSYRGFHETITNYTPAQLRAYYAEVFAYMQSNGYEPKFKVYPGGASDEVTQEVNPEYFKMGMKANGSEEINVIPLDAEYNMGRYGNDLADATALTTAQARIDSLIAARGWMILYTHNYSWSANSLANLGTLLDYIATKISSGQAIRMVTINDGYNIIKKLL